MAPKGPVIDPRITIMNHRNWRVSSNNLRKRCKEIGGETGVSDELWEPLGE